MNAVLPKVKLALCMQRTNAPAEFQEATTCRTLNIPRHFWDTPTQLINRAICETDESTLQFIPYIVLMNESNKIFSYYRGGAGEESRLHSKVSIGLGGHVDEAVREEDEDNEEALLHLMQREGARELDEEAGIKEASLRFVALLVDPTDAVGRVHIGLLSIHHIKDAAALVLEADVIEKGNWISLDGLQDERVFSRLENWSKAVVMHLAEGGL